jgi:hypothetical protein
VLYADGVSADDSEPMSDDSKSDDPFFIVPAVLPDDEPVTPAPATRTTRRPMVEEPTPEATVSSSTEVPRAPTRAVTFERRPVRRTTRIVRHIDAWSVFKVAIVFHFVLYLTLLLAGVLLWNVANATGTVDNVERFLESFGWESFEFKGGELFHQAWTLGLFAVVGLTGLAVLMVTTFNLITDLVGGIRVTVLEEKPTPPSPRG